MSKGYLIIGAGGHGKVIADIMSCLDLNVIGFVDDNTALVGRRILDLPVLGPVERWASINPEGIIIAVGNNQTRRTIVLKLEQYSPPPWCSVSHPSAIIAKSTQIGAGTVMMAGAVINPDTKIGSHSIVNTGATVDHDCHIGDYVHIAPGVNLAGGVKVGDGAFIGIGCSVLPNCVIGAEAIIGAGATVITDVPIGVTAKGTPARWSY